MEKRVLLAVVLSIGVLYGYQALFPPARPQAPPAVPVEPQPQSSDLEKQGPAPTTTPAPSQPVAAQPLVADANDREIVVESAAVRAVFSTRGAVLKSWQLKRYVDEHGAPLDLIPAKAPAGSARPFTLVVDDAAVSAMLSQALYKPSADGLNTSRSPGSLTFEYRDASGVSARKEFAFSPDQPYLILFSAEVTAPGGQLNPAVTWGPALGTGVVSSGLTYSPSSQPIFYRDGDVNRIGFDDIAEYRSVEGTVGFAGVDDHYFLTAVIPPPQPSRIQYDPVSVPVQGSDKSLQFVSWSARFASTPSKARFFAGPKDFDVLAGIGQDMVRAIHFGVFSPLVVPLLRALNWVNGYIGNYGWSIIVLTIIINLAMFPLRHKSVVSMRKMQELQPEMKAIQDRYAKLKMNDPARQKMNVELMNLYRERGVNPASGCVPMLLTMPVLFGFYSMLSVAIELRGAPFIGWIRDLSVYDPWFVTPVLMGATQFVQTRMTPATGDPQQQKMMLFMPLIFMTMFIWAPSGLVLYWTVSNLWAIGQQVLTNRLIGASPQRTVRPAAERRVKTAGGGKSDAAKERK
ncbi:MAG: membrane protein insertase YidC [Vicinamibacterales bacterium]